jgi:RNA polymerase sigma-70 factor (family 1)
VKKLSPADLQSIQFRIARDDQAALKILFDHYSDDFFQLANAIIRSKEMAEEIVEDVFIQVWKKRSQIKSIENFPLYLYVTTRNISISYLRKWRNKKQVSFDDIELPYYQIDISPEEIMISAEIIQRINLAINQLPPKCRLIFKLVKEDGLKHREAAELLNLHLKTVENQVGIALKKIQSAIKIYLPQAT